MQTFRQNSIVFEKPGILSENLKTLNNSNCPSWSYSIFLLKININSCNININIIALIFLLKLHTRFLLTNVYKRCVGFFWFCLDLELFPKTEKDLFFFTYSFFTFLLITQDLNKIREIPYPLLQTLLSRKRVQNVS